MRTVVAITASMQPESARIVYARSDCPHPFQFCCFQRRHGSYCAKLTWIWSGWPGQGLAKHVYTSGLEASWCAEIIGPGFWQWFCSSTDVPDSTVQNQPGSNLVLADCVRFWPNGSDPEASWCARIIWPTSGQCFQADPHWIQIGSGMFTGKASWFSVRIHSLQPMTWSCTWFFKYLFLWHVFKGDSPHILLLQKPWCLLFSLKN